MAAHLHKLMSYSGTYYSHTLRVAIINHLNDLLAMVTPAPLQETSGCTTDVIKLETSMEDILKVRLFS